MQMFCVKFMDYATIFIQGLFVSWLLTGLLTWILNLKSHMENPYCLLFVCLFVCLLVVRCLAQVFVIQHNPFYYYFGSWLWLSWWWFNFVYSLLCTFPLSICIHFISDSIPILTYIHSLFTILFVRLFVFGFVWFALRLTFSIGQWLTPIDLSGPSLVEWQLSMYVHHVKPRQLSCMGTVV